ncbi:CoA-transferase [Saccharata proteae CBS 121410]|uniref:CoA-transferase n=1 Tax=Saccharata proteae CBS 121410 TaxID=1314787 RepID=A0A9P4M0F7_9PEZI|nr:CoA-transferase [Saccharata proteae CBS 121410]
MSSSAALRRLALISGHFLRLRSRRVGQTRSLATKPKAAGPLAGIKILDLSRVLAAPYCTQILADYGADVIKVDQPEVGDDSRHWVSEEEKGKWDSSIGPMSLYFNSVNRNKRSITLDLKKAEAQEILCELVRKSDVLLENFVPGKADELGIGYENMSNHNPGLIYASISAYGPTGPYGNRAGYDAIAAAEAGLMHITGEPGRPPVRPGLGLVDMSTGLYMHGAILGALRAREQTGQGQKLDASLFETQISLLINIGANWLNLGLEGKRYGSAHPSIVPYNTFETKDGYLALGANNDRQFKVLTERIERQELLEDPRFSTNALRVENRGAMDSIMNKVLKQRTNDEWMKVLEGSGLAHGPVNNIEQAFAHPQAQARGMVDSIQCEQVETGEIKVIGIPVKFSETKGRIRARAPFLGEHTAEVLEEIGYSDERIARLKREIIT